ncbi:MAG: dihydroneopterin aldolase [Gemmatimonadaceae bacterium]
MQEITLRGMRFHALVGILEHERQVPQPIEVDLLVRVAEDSAASVVDYRRLYDLTAAALAGHSDFLEQVAERIARDALDASPRVRSARVAVRKPHVALAGPLAYAEVVVERTAGER